MDGQSGAEGELYDSSMFYISAIDTWHEVATAFSMACVVAMVTLIFA